MSLTAKKLDYIFWRLAKFTYNCWWAFLLFRCGVQEKIEPNWKNYLIWIVGWGRKPNTLDTQNTIIIFLSAIAVMLMIFWTEDLFCCISDCINSYNCKLKKLVNKEMIVFYNPSNAICSSKKSVQIKHFKDHAFIGVCSLFIWFNLEILNFC